MFNSDVIFNLIHKYEQNIIENFEGNKLFLTNSMFNHFLQICWDAYIKSKYSMKSGKIAINLQYFNLQG